MKNRIRELREKVRLSQEALGEAAGTTKQHISRLEKGDTRLTNEWMRRLAAPLGVRAIDLLVDEDRTTVNLPDQPTTQTSGLHAGILDVSGAEIAAVPRFDLGISAGPGSLIERDPEPLGYHLVEAQWLRSVTRATPDHLMVVHVDGDSMEPTLADGDWILVDTTQQRPTRQGLYVLRVGPDVWVKRLTVSLRDKRVVVISDNPAYPEERLTDDELEIIGRVVWIVGRRV